MSEIDLLDFTEEGDFEEMGYGYPRYDNDDYIDTEEAYALACEKRERELNEAKAELVQQAETIIECTDLVVYKRKEKDGSEIPVYGLIVGEGKVYVPKEGIIDYGDAEPLYSCTIDTYSMLQRLYELSKKSVDMQADIQRLEHKIADAQRIKQDVEVEQAKIYAKYCSMLKIECEKEKLKQIINTDNL